MIPNTFDKNVKDSNLTRLEELSYDIIPLWGKMDSAQMMAHVNVAYRMALNENTKINRGFKRFIISLLAKNK